jgi:hypothetical protein
MARQKEEVGRPFTVRIRSAQLAALEAWMAREGEAGLSHQKAILRLVAAGIRGVKNSPEVADVIMPPAPKHDIAELEAIERDAARIAELEAEVADLRRQLAERADPPAYPLAKLSPECRAEFERIVAAGTLERLLEATVRRHDAARQAKEREAAPAPEAAPSSAPAAEAPKPAMTPSQIAAAKLDEIVAKSESARLTHWSVI